MTQEALKNKAKTFPDAPGIYVFYNAKKELVYVGKATSLRSRVGSYFTGPKTRRPIEQMMQTVTKIAYKETDSVLEAIIAEANWIKKYQPAYNVLGKDNKSWNYLVITNDDYPRLEAFRFHQFQLLSKTQQKQFSHVFGPFPGLNTKQALRLLRRLFTISTCKPEAKRPCLYRQMKQCLGVCTGDISAAAYKRDVIMPLITLLKGGKKRLLGNIKKRMAGAAKKEQFEEAARLRNQLHALERIHDMALLNKSFVQDDMGEHAHELRVEGYDISNLGNTGKVGSMVVSVGGEQAKSRYRKFKIKTVEGQSDVDCIEEVLLRRFRHPEWQYPAVVMVDGGLPQVNRAKKVLTYLRIAIPVVGIAKGAERKKNEFVLGSKNPSFVAWVASHKKELIALRDEAHRFAIAYQRSTRQLKK